MDKYDDLIQRLKTEAEILKESYVLDKIDLEKRQGARCISKIAMHVRIREAGFSILWRKLQMVRSKSDGKIKTLIHEINKGKSETYDPQLIKDTAAEWEVDLTMEYEKRASILRRSLMELTSEKRKASYAEQRRLKIEEYVKSLEKHN
jgi:hypothetical protein